MTQLQEEIRDKITKYSDACGMCTDTTRECNTCDITCVLEDLNELQKLADNPDAVRPTAHIMRGTVQCTYDAGFCSNCKLCIDEDYGTALAKSYSYCPHCGARYVKWNITQPFID